MNLLKTVSSFLLAAIGLIHKAESNADKSNLVIISLEDVGISDIGSYGSEFVTPNLDKLISEESLSLKSHYVGYSGSLSKSQLLSGIYSFYSGYHTINKEFDSFKHSTIGSVPLSYNLLSDYLKSGSDNSNNNNHFNNYYIGSWDLGYSLKEQLPNERGFDYFFGMLTNENNVLTKKSSISFSNDNNDLSIDPKFIDYKKGFFDFWENDKLLNNENDITKYDSNSLFTKKAIDIIEDGNNKYNKDSSMYMHVSFQGPNSYKDYNYNLYDKTISDKCVNVENNERNNLCLYMQHLDSQINLIVESLKNTKKWENTLLLIISNNGGSLSLGSCNFPYRGGVNTFFDGNLRSLALVSGGLLPENKKGISLDGLFSNVDWLPTLLSFFGAIDENSNYFKEFDGINMKNYLFDNEHSRKPLRDHIMFHMSAFGYDNIGYIDESLDSSDYKRNWGWTDDSSSDDSDNVETETSDDGTIYYETLNEIAMVFYDTNGKLYKYFVTEDSLDIENKYGKTDNDLSSEYNWCVMDNNNYLVTDEYNEFGVLSGLYELTTDVSEQFNLLTSISLDEFTKLKAIIMEKADLYLDNKETGDYTNQLQRSFDCFTKKRNILAYPGTNNDNAWMPFVSSLNEYKSLLNTECGFAETDELLIAHTTKSTSTELTDLTHYFTQKMHTRVPSTLKRYHHTHTINLNAINSKASKKNAEITIEDTDNVYSDCYGLSDGYYYIQIDFDESKPIILVQCSNNYMLIDYSFEENWSSYFLSWHQSHTQVASPIKTDACNWQEWFLPDSGNGNYNYIVSQECNTCNEDSLYQTNGKSTTYWENAVNSYCATNSRGMPAGDTKWLSYTCRELVYSGVYGVDSHTNANGLRYATFVNDWASTDLNGIDKDVLLTSLAGGNGGNLGTCLTVKQAADNDHFTTVEECEETDVGNGNLPTIGINGKYCVCASKNDEVTVFAAKSGSKKRELTIAEKIHLKNTFKKQNINKDEMVKQNENEKVFELYQSDFKSGTFRIQESGTYVIMEDIVFDYNAPDYENEPNYSANRVYSEDGDLYWYPKVSQKEEYPGAYKFHDPYLLGFFAGITVEVNDVIIDLNGYTLKMDDRYFFQQPFWSHIELASQPFVPGEGPSHFGATPQYVSNVEIKNGILGLTSHHCVHGTAPEASLMKNIKLNNLVCKDFVTHGIQINGFNGLQLNNVEIGPNANRQFLTVDYSQMRTLLPRFEYFADLYGNEKTFTFGGKPDYDFIKENNLFDKVSLSNDKEYTLRDILDEMIDQMDMAFDFVTNRKSDNELYEEYGNKWLQSKRVFVETNQNGIPYGGVIYGLYLNYPSSGISGFYRNSDKSYNVELNNVYIHDIEHSSREEMYLLKSMRTIFALPIIARFWGGEDMVENFADIEDDTRVYYYGTIVYDWFVAYYNILKDDIANVEATNLLYFGDTALDWVSGDSQITGESLGTNYMLTCNGDPMFHSVKGIFGLRLTNVENAVINNVVVDGLSEYSPIGSDVCGEYDRSHDIQQQLPYLWGFTGNNIHGVSVLDSRVLFNDLKVQNLNSMTGNATGISVYPRSNVKFDGENNEFKNILSGTQFKYNNMDYDELDSLISSPNQMPRACAIKVESFDQIKSSIIVESFPLNNDKNNKYNTKLSFECIDGYVGCSDTIGSDVSDFGLTSDSNVKSCDSSFVSKTISKTGETISTFSNDYQPLSSAVPAGKAPSKHNQLLAKLSSNIGNTHNKSKNNHMIIVMVCIVFIAVFTLLVSLFHSLDGQNKLGEINAQMKGYTRL